MKITVTGDHAALYTPYNADFVARIKSIGGARWNPTLGAWTIPSNMVDAARELMRCVFGVDDTTTECNPITLQVTFHDEVSTIAGDVTMYGRCLSHASGRDSGARCGENVAFLSGAPESGGSAKNWRSVVPAGSVVLLKDVPEALYLSRPEISGCTVTPIESPCTSRIELQNELDRLLVRIAEIKSQLETK